MNKTMKLNEIECLTDKLLSYKNRLQPPFYRFNVKQEKLLCAVLLFIVNS